MKNRIERGEPRGGDESRDERRKEGIKGEGRKGRDGEAHVTSSYLLLSEVLPLQQDVLEEEPALLRPLTDRCPAVP